MGQGQQLLRFSNQETTNAKSAGKLDVLRLNGHALGMDGSKVGVLKERDEVGLGSFLKGTDGG